MAGGLPRPGVNKIPVIQVTIETYKLVWSLRGRIGRWAMLPLIYCTILLMVFFEAEAFGPNKARTFGTRSFDCG